MKIISYPLSTEKILSIKQYWALANYLSVGQIYLLDNPLLKQPLKIDHIKPRLLGHWGTTPGLNLIYIHLNRMIVKTESKMLFITGPGHGGPALVANTFIEGSYTKYYPQIEQNEKGLKQLYPFSKLAGKKANILIFPNLSAANISYNLLSTAGEMDIIGPILLGLKKPVHILQLGSSVRQIVDMVGIAAMHAQAIEQ